MNKLSSSCAACLRVTWRSEAFAEDLIDAASSTSANDAHERQADPAPWSLVLVPMLVALVGMAFAVVPALA